MGSAPCNLFCCTKPSIALPKSDLFVPQINIDIIQNTKNLETNVITNFLDKSPRYKLQPIRQTTEKCLQEKYKIRNSLTVGGRGKKVKISLLYEDEKDKYNDNKISAKNNDRYIINNSKTYKTKNSSKKDFKNFTLKKEKDNDNNNSENSDKEEESNYELSEHPLTKDEEINIFNVFLDHYLFNNFDKEILLSSLKQLKEISIEKDSVIFKEGDIGSCIFVIISGEVGIFSNNSKEKIVLYKGSIFGELAIMKNNFKRTYTAVAITGLSIFTLDKNFLQKIKSDFIVRTPFNFELFNFLSEEQKENLELLVNNIEFKDNQKIKNLKGLFWIQSGSICFDNSSGKEKDIYEKGEFIGMLKYNYCNSDTDDFEKEKIEKDYYTSSILEECNKNKLKIDIITKGNTVCNVIHEMALIEVFGLDFKSKLLFPFFEKTIMQNKYFKNIFDESNNIKEIINLFHLKEYRNNDMLSSTLPDDIKKKIIIIIEGQASIYYGNGPEKNIIAPSQIIGETIILGEEQKNIIVESNHLISLECSWDIFKENINFMGNTLIKWINNLNSIYFFRGLSVYKLVDIAKNIKIKKYKEGDKIIKKSEKVEFVYFIHKGTLHLQIDEEIFQELHTNNSFGEIFIFDGKPAFGEIFVPDKK